MKIGAKTIFFILGPQGSGKGTQARLLARKLGYFSWDMGAVLREERDFRLADGKSVGEITDTGQYLSDEQILQVLAKRLHEIPAGQGIVFDGVPRRIGQAEFLLKHLRSLAFSDFTTLHITVSRDESLKRLMLRAEKEKRIDDTPEAIALRLKQAEELTGPLLEYLKMHSRVIEIDGTPPIEEVTKQIDAALKIAS